MFFLVNFGLFAHAIQRGVIKDEARDVHNGFSEVVKMARHISVCFIAFVCAQSSGSAISNHSTVDLAHTCCDIARLFITPCS